MLGTVMAAPGRVELKEFPKPEIIESSMAIVKITRAGICGSDLLMWDGRVEVNDDAIIGHEYLGIVEEVGPDVRLIETGDRVTGTFSVACGHCRQCQLGFGQRCLLLRFIGFGFAFGDLHGGQAEYIAVPEADLTLRTVPDVISDDAGLLVGDNAVTAVDVLHRARFEPGQVVAILGAGPTGLLTAQAALAMGAGAVVIADRLDHRLKVATEFGATAVNIDTDDAQDAVLDLSGYQGADIVVEATNTVQGTAEAIALARKGGTIAVTTVHADGEVTIPLGEMWLKDHTLVMHQVNVNARMDDVIAMIAAGRLTPEKVISHRLALSDVAQGYEVMGAREALKVILTP